MVDLQFLTQFMLQNFELTQVKDNGSHFLSRCPLCGDSKKNLYKKRFNMNWNNGVPGWHCFNCGRHGNLIEIYSIIKGVSFDEAKKEIFKYDKESIKNRVREYKTRPSEQKVKQQHNNSFNWILNECFDINTQGEGLLQNRYIQELKKFYETRKIDKKYKIYICYNGKYKGRLIIPIFDENKNIIYFQARRIPKSVMTPKYDNPVSPKELCILNKHKFNENDSIIITEGLIDAFMIGNQGTTCLGKEISENLIKTLLKLTNKDVIICLDNDSEAYKSLATFMRKNKLSKKVKYFLYPNEFGRYKDINNMCIGNKKTINIYEFITTNAVNYSTAYTKLSISKLLGDKKNENNKHRNRLYKGR